MNLSIIIPTLNDSDLLNTLQSVRETCGEKCEVIIVDDHSDHLVQIPSRWKNLRLIRNDLRMGVAKSRHIGAENASGDVLLFLDAHMRCEPGWLEKAVPKLEASPKTIFNGSCLGLREGNMDITKFSGAYTGATLCIYDPQKKEILEGKWAKHEDNQEIACLMGAIYFVPKDVYFAIGGLKSLEQWGTDEPFLSLKAWLAGYEIRQMNDVRMGHKFRSAAPYRTSTLWLPYNKIRSIMTIFDQPTAEFLVNKFPKNEAFSSALNKIRERRRDIIAEHEFHQSIFKYDLNWYCNKFGVKHPLS
jgi:glycosyltransferase involved in cell wall biosynthesis